MSWFFVDDKFFAHAKLAKLSRDELSQAVSLWTLAGAWSRCTLSGGHVPYHQVDALRCSYSGAEALVKCGLWVAVDDGFHFHDWAQWQETPEEVDRKRTESRLRTQKWRAKKPGAKRKKRDASPTRHSRVSDVRVPGEGEGEGEGTYKREVREQRADPSWMLPATESTYDPDSDPNESPGSLAVLARLRAVAR